MKKLCASGTWPIKLYVIDHAETESEVQITPSRQVFSNFKKLAKNDEIQR